MSEATWKERFPAWHLWYAPAYYLLVWRRHGFRVMVRSWRNWREATKEEEAT